MHSIARAAFAVAIVLTLSACQTWQRSPEEREPAARIGSETVSVAELDEYVKEELFRERTRNRNGAKLYQVRKGALEKLIRERVLAAEAAKRGVDEETLVAEELETLGPVTDEEVEEFYEKNRDRVEQSGMQNPSETIRAYLEQQRREKAMQAIEERGDFAVLLRQPRYVVEPTGPAIGPEDAPITIVEFSDFECPYCRRASDIVKEVRGLYPDQVRVVYRQFPLEKIHPRARAAAEASLCAADQDRFWAYHDKLFAGRSLSDDDFVNYARDLELDVDAFQACVSERVHKDTVDQDLEQGGRAGVTGTPAFFVNGIPLSGARPVESFTEVIDSELERIGEGA